MNNIMPPINTPDNAFHDGNPATGEQGTIVPGLWLNNSQGATRNIQQEIISVLAEAEIEIDETKDNQLLTAILSLITASIPDLPVASLTQAGIVKLISSLTSDSESLAATAKAVKLVANAIVTSMSDHIQTANPHHQYLAIANFLSEIKDVGPAAVAQTLLNLGLGDGSTLPVGVPVPWPLSVPPTGWMKCNGSSFNMTANPKLAIAYPSGILPDLRGEVVRGWDDGRGIDAGRTLLSEQLDALQNITGGIFELAHGGSVTASASGAFVRTNGTTLGNGAGAGGTDNFSFDASRVARTATETRMRNIAFNYIVRAI